MKLILQSTVLIFLIYVLIAAGDYLKKNRVGFLFFKFPEPTILHSILKTHAIVGSMCHYSGVMYCLINTHGLWQCGDMLFIVFLSPIRPILE